MDPEDEEVQLAALQTEKAEPIHRQLERQGYVPPQGETEGPSVVGDLHNLTCVVIVVDKLRMGEQVPKTTRFFDVRCCYLEPGINSKSAFVQDVGRCAGHGKSPATVFTGLDVDPNDPTAFLRLDTTLKKGTDDPVDTDFDHPENEIEGVYSKFKPNLVILDAAPQIGKTGAVIAFLDLLRRHYLFPLEGREAPKYPEINPTVGSQSSDAPQQKVSELKTETDRWRAIINGQNGLKTFQSAVAGKPFQDYHDMHEAASEVWKDLLELKAELVAILKSKLPVGPKLLIADCGCGRKGVAALLRANRRWSQHTIVYGFDVEDRRRIPQTEKVLHIVCT